MGNNIVSFIKLLIFCFFIFSCSSKELKSSDTEPLESTNTEQPQYSVLGKWLFEEDNGGGYIFTFTDTHCFTFYVGDDREKTATYEIVGEKIFTINNGRHYEWDYEFQDEDTLKINIEADRRYFMGKRVKNNATTLSGVYRIVNGVGFIYSFDFIDSSNVKITWAPIHGDFITDNSTYEIKGTSVILSSEVLNRNLEIVGDSFLLITGLPNGIIANFAKE
jgi:hypothetical protein